MKLDYLCFAGDLIWDRRIREESNYCDSSHIFAATYAVTQLILHEISPCDLLDVKTGEIRNSQWITPIPGTIDQTRRIQKTCWDGDTFKVFWKWSRETACIAAR